jgi:hypothetical protein
MNKLKELIIDISLINFEQAMFNCRIWVHNCLKSKHSKEKRKNICYYIKGVVAIATQILFIQAFFSNAQ